MLANFTSFLQKIVILYKIPLIILSCGIVVFIALIFSQEINKSGNHTEKVWLVNVQPIQIASFSPQITLFGKVKNSLMSKLSSSLTAYVTSITVFEGEKVNKDQLVLTLDPIDAELILKQRVALVAELEADIAKENVTHEMDLKRLELEETKLKLQQDSVERHQKLIKSGTISQATLDQEIVELQEAKLQVFNRKLIIDNFPIILKNLNSKLDNAKAQVKQAELDLKRTKLLAPFDGIVGNIHVGVGDLVHPDELLLEIFSLNDMLIEAQISKNYIAIINQELKNKRELHGNAVIHNENFAIATKALDIYSDQGHGGVDGLFYFKDPLPNVAINEVATITLELPKVDNAITIPLSALYKNDQVFLIQDGRLHAVTVTIHGYLKNGEQEKIIVSAAAFKDGEHILTSALSNAVNGLRVEITA